MLVGMSNLLGYCYLHLSTMKPQDARTNIKLLPNISGNQHVNHPPVEYQTIKSHITLILPWKVLDYSVKPIVKNRKKTF